jgi:hypothetical protein
MKIIRGSLFAVARAAAFGLMAVSGVAKTHQAKTKSEASPATSTQNSNAAASEKAPSNAVLGKKETLTGRLYMVEPAQKLVVVKDSGDIPFDITVTRHTKILVNNQTAELANLKDHVNSPVTIQFVPRDQGDFAQTIQTKAG